MRDKKYSDRRDAADIYTNKDGIGRYVGWRRRRKMRMAGKIQIDEDRVIIQAIWQGWWKRMASDTAYMMWD